MKRFVITAWDGSGVPFTTEMRDMEILPNPNTFAWCVSTDLHDGVSAYYEPRVSDVDGRSMVWREVEHSTFDVS